MTSEAKTVEEYLQSLPEERRQAIARLREVVLANMPKGIEEVMQYGMISYVVPYSIFPAGYHTKPKQPLPYASLASQKNYMTLYVLGPYADAEENAWFRTAYADAGKKLDMGGSCVRFKKLDDLPLDVIGELFRRSSIEQYVAKYEQNLAASKLGRTKK